MASLLAWITGSGEGTRAFTSAELAVECTDDKLLVALAGKVYDVSNRPDMYGPQASYHRLVGRDATRALTTMVLKSVDDGPLAEADMDETEKETLGEWVAKYDSKYEVLGTLAPSCPEDESAAAAIRAAKAATPASAPAPAPAPAGGMLPRQEVPVKLVPIPQEVWALCPPPAPRPADGAMREPTIAGAATFLSEFGADPAGASTDALGAIWAVRYEQPYTSSSAEHPFSASHTH
jgi:membrane-associated progesterone receptor component